MHQNGCEPNDVQRLQQAIHDLHGLDCEHVESVPINETFENNTTWKGTVEVFRVCGQAYEEQVYAWSYKAESGEKRHVAVLGVLPINSPGDAVRVVVARGVVSPFVAH